MADFARARQNQPGNLPKARGAFEDERLRSAASDRTNNEAGQVYAEAASKKMAFDRAKDALAGRRLAEVQTGKLGVDLAVESNNLRNQSRLTPTAVRNVAGRNCLEIGGVWIDDGYDVTMATLSVKAQSPAYFRILERHPQVKDVYRLGNHLLWVTPSRRALVVDTTDGKDQLTDAEIDALFTSGKK